MATDEGTPQRHKVGAQVDPRDTCTWIEQFGYYAIIVGFTPFSGGSVGIAYGRPNQHPYIAVPGQTLVWDGHTLTVEEALS